MPRKEKEKTQEKEEMVLIYDPGKDTSYDVKLSSALKWIKEAKKLEARLKEEGKI